VAGRISAAVRASGRHRRLQILEATLRIIRRGGLRAISHRAVAAEASVPLAATTYYFRDLEDLITESFLHWSQSAREQVKAFHAAAVEVLEQAALARTSQSRLVDRLADVAAGYVVEQVTVFRSDRVLEFAYLHEAARMPKLRAVVQARQLEDRAFLEQFFVAVGSHQPGVEAQIAHSLLLGLEKGALLADSGEAALASIRQVVAVHLRRVLPANPGRARRGPPSLK
jgi:DNA-binding transcriptional regulator YbjK